MAGRVQWEARLVLPVAHGQRGLRASDAVFHHVKNLPVLYDRCVRETGSAVFDAVSVSTQPRPIVESYLPPFVAGISSAELIACTLAIPLLRTSHQEGHIRAGLYGDGDSLDLGDHFHALHISGGTTELLKVHRVRPGQFDVALVGGSDDLFAGQFIDRLGVALGLPFPSGRHLEELARGSVNPVALPFSPPRSKDTGVWISFSGLTTAALRAVPHHLPADVARGVEMALSRTLLGLIHATMAPGPLLIVGGVAANGQLRLDCTRELEPSQGWSVQFGTPELSRDNAVGVALIGWDRITMDKGDEDGTDS